MNQQQFFLDYKEAVLKDFHERRAKGHVPGRLIRLTPANVKKECLAICIERFNNKDERLLRDFFGQHSGQEGYIKAIKSCDIDKFRPLINYINQRTGDTADLNIELLAWLIDFGPRPYATWKKSGSTMETVKDERLPAMAGEETEDEEAVGNQDKAGANLRVANRKVQGSARISKRALFFILPLMLIPFIYYQWGIESIYGNKVSDNGTCMYWTGDHYERISCVQREDTLVVPADEKKLSRFRKILNPDTVTESSIGRLWYRKKDKKLELFTDKGYHPVDVKVKLRVLSAYMYHKYLARNGGVNNN